MRNRGLMTELLGHPERDLWRKIVGAVIRARAELAIIMTLLTVYVMLVKTTAWSYTTVMIVETSSIVLLIVLPGVRARMWAVISRHRIWKCMYETRTMTPRGTMPYLLWARPSPVGERIRVWLPAGLSVNDLHQITEPLAAACFASEARVEESRQRTHLVVITIVRRDPYKKRLLPNFTTLLTRKTKTGETFTPLPDRDGLPVPPVPTSPAQHPTVTAAMKTAKTRDRATTTASSTRASAAGTNHPPPDNPELAPPTVVGVGGTDVSDYV